jgi:hypothetical protein
VASWRNTGGEECPFLLLHSGGGDAKFQRTWTWYVVPVQSGYVVEESNSQGEKQGRYCIYHAHGFLILAKTRAATIECEPGFSFAALFHDSDFQTEIWRPYRPNCDVHNSVHPGSYAISYGIKRSVAWIGRRMDEVEQTLTKVQIEEFREAFSLFDKGGEL